LHLPNAGPNGDENSGKWLLFRQSLRERFFGGKFFPVFF
jgi:hypothetical protein